LIDTDNSTDHIYYGIYYDLRNKPEMVKKYYLMEIAKWNVLAMLLLGKYYEHKRKYDHMKYYYLLSVEFGSFRGMFRLGMYYKKIYKFDLMKKYFDMILNNTLPVKNKTQYDAIVGDTLCEYGDYYRYCNHDKMKEYYFKAIEKGNKRAMYLLSDYYKDRHQYYLSAKYELMVNNLHTDEQRIKDLASMYEYDDIRRRTTFNNMIMMVRSS
jgi:hypothetical protein